MSLARRGNDAMLICDYGECRAVVKLDDALVYDDVLTLNGEIHPPGDWIAIFVETNKKRQAKDFCCSRHASIGVARMLV